ncbi:hypothetical protein Pcinc_009066 [Petrolisthes cinctipes]|uniref:Uncharacterized protein n=1 Tax=Petrolisthes cinctipes TaxID=88211 RepID=A0AAE1G7P9_PETCI|nr:hypothetical protein Pcinc_009066 [Petrolisthes cinctipes]
MSTLPPRRVQTEVAEGRAGPPLSSTPLCVSQCYLSARWPAQTERVVELLFAPSWQVPRLETQRDVHQGPHWPPFKNVHRDAQQDVPGARSRWTFLVTFPLDVTLSQMTAVASC